MTAGSFSSERKQKLEFEKRKLTHDRTSLNSDEKVRLSAMDSTFFLGLLTTAARPQVVQAPISSSSKSDLQADVGIKGLSQL